MWEFDDNNNIQKLKGLQAVCDNCHNIKHIGFVNVQVSSGIWPESKLDDLANHFMKVNNVTRKEFNSMLMKHLRYGEKGLTKNGQ